LDGTVHEYGDPVFLNAIKQSFPDSVIETPEEESTVELQFPLVTVAALALGEFTTEIALKLLKISRNDRRANPACL
jgi:hypothetical protein